MRFFRTLEERVALVESATKFYLESRLWDTLEQFKEGLECLSLLSYMNRHSSLFREVFIYAEKPLLAKDIASLFKAQRSPPGTNQRAIEIRVVCFWRDWLLEVEDGNAYPLTLEKVLIFTSGASAIPRLGYPVEPQLQFLHKQENEAARIYTEANTCSIALRLLIHPNYADMRQKMESGIVQSSKCVIVKDSSHPSHRLLSAAAWQAVLERYRGPRGF
ncbi:G2/M phase-specific E3 ubiquitin-protein ligase [Oncorhynchus kisutch]|uniref:G2/M phase-specific E3 ubiquitin-protein ligase n=1 Tax=Oncorhynchus kisutch TaxID=8019 RepID=UPI0012DF8B51|nr:G2/M phase-specific E3 ubiquitin-protein ligase-like [Oncorhynchus kisutch]